MVIVTLHGTGKLGSGVRHNAPSTSAVVDAEKTSVCFCWLGPEWHPAHETLHLNLVLGKTKEQPANPVLTGKMAVKMTCTHVCVCGTS